MNRTAQIPAFSESEMTVIGSHISTNSAYGSPPVKLNSPITPLENLRACLRRDGSALWIPHVMDFLAFESRANRDHIARGEVCDLGPVLRDEEKGGPDLFGVEWQYVPVTHGSMVRPGSPLLEDANDWEKLVRFPDVAAMGWEECGRLNAPLRASERGISVTFQNGMFERLISFMDFAGALIAVVDDDQKDAIHALFSKLCDMYEAMIDGYLSGCRVDGIKFHDDWGTQRAPMFRPEVCREMIVPYIRRLSDFCHSRGLWFELHCCGKNEMLVPCMIEAGVDMWYGQPMNDLDMLREQYGSKIILAAYPEDTNSGMSDAEIDEIAYRFAKKYAPDLGERPVMMFNLFADKRLVPQVYRHTRRILSGQE